MTGTRFPTRDGLARFFNSESELLHALGGLLTRIPGISGIRITHGVQELGRDLVFLSQSPLGEAILSACLVKNAKLSLNVGSRSSAHALLSQVDQAFDSPYVDESGRERFVDRVYVVTPFEMSEASIASVRGLLRREVGRLVFISGSTLSDLFSRYWPEFIVFDRHSSGTKASKVQSGGPDFFVSYNQADRKWAEWIAWTLESAGYKSTIQAWDFVPGTNFVLEMQRALERAKRIVMVLSQAYLESQFTAPEWAGFFAKDPEGKERKLLPVRVGECQPEGLLRAITYIDLVSLAEEDATAALIGALSERSKPSSVPFPSDRVRGRSAFPGKRRQISDETPKVARQGPRERNVHRAMLSEAKSRARLFKQLTALRAEHFNMLVFALKPPTGLVAAMSEAPQEKRSEQILTWAEATKVGGCGLDVVFKVLRDIRDR